MKVGDYWDFLKHEAGPIAGAGETLVHEVHMANGGQMSSKGRGRG